MSTQKPFIRRERRFEVGDLTGFDAIVNRTDVDDSVFFAELIDFSRTGVKFGLPFCAKFDEMLQIKFEFKHTNLKYEGTGRVRHIRNIQTQRWHVGCSIDPPLNEEVISFLAKRTSQERRRYHRIEVDGEGTLVRQGTLDDCKAHLINISEGGFCLFVDKEQEPGQRVDFRIKNKHGEEENIAARVRWQKEMDGGFRIGCGYADSASYEKLVSCLSFNESIYGEEKISWYVTAAAILAMFLPPLSYFLLGTGSIETQSFDTVAAVSATDSLKANSLKMPPKAVQPPTQQFGEIEQELWPMMQADEEIADANLKAAEKTKSATFETQPNVAVTESSRDVVPTAPESSLWQQGELAVASVESMISLLPFNIFDKPAAESNPAANELASAPAQQPKIVDANTRASAGNFLRGESTQATNQLLGISTRRHITRVSQTRPKQPSQQIGFDSVISRPEIEPVVKRFESAASEPSPDASSRRGSTLRPVLVPSEIIRKRLMSDPPNF